MSWQPSTSVETLKARAKVLSDIRGFFKSRDVIEVQTSVLASHTVTDLNIESIEVPGYGYLQTSPEFQMKRLLAAGMPSCYQICPVFRDGERGRWHNPEFTMLEWYRLGFSLSQQINEVTELFDLVLGSQPYVQLTVRDLLSEIYDADVFVEDQKKVLKRAENEGLVDCDDYADAFDFLLDKAVEARQAPRLVLTEYPPHGRALAKLQHTTGTTVAQRFEIIIQGQELANGYDELQDSSELEQRMHEDNKLRRKNGKVQVAGDVHLLDAMTAGLPNCAGVAVGLDRLIALQLNASSIDEVMPFPLPY